MSNETGVKILMGTAFFFGLGWGAMLLFVSQLQWHWIVQ